MTDEYQGEAWRKAGLYDLLKAYALGNVKFSKQTLRKIEAEMAKAERKLNREMAPKSKRPGYHEHVRKIWRRGQRKWRENNPDYEYGLNRRYTRLLKHCRERGIECTLTLAEYEVLMEGVTPEDKVRLVRRDLSKGYTLENTVVVPESKYFKLLALRRKSKNV